MKKITFEIETITPMFLAGADQSKAELRVASIKGLLRFWWRALQAETDLAELRKKESHIFGSSDETTGGGCSFAIRINNAENLKPITRGFPGIDKIHTETFWSNKQNKQITINILEYLAYGPFDPRNRRIRPYFDTKSKFNLIFHFRDNGHIDDVLKAMYVFSLFGGLGARCRNGFGSFSISKQEGDISSFGEIISPANKYPINRLRELISNNSPVQPYSSFSQGTKIFCAKQPMNTWHESLADVGKIYRGIRVGVNKLNNAVFEQKHHFDKRQYLGAPLDPYQENFHSFLDRHAKPYFIKMAIEGSKYRSYILYLPSQYCEGFDKGRHGVINHTEVNREFIDVCNEFNKFLAEHMETIL